MKTRKVEPSAAAVRLRDKVLRVMRRPEFEALSAPEMLATLAYTVGQLVALQDQRTMTPAQAMKLVADNIEAGNSDAIAKIFEGPGGTA